MPPLQHNISTKKSQSNSNEGSLFTANGINTEADFEAWLRDLLPLFDDADIAKVLTQYPSGAGSSNTSQIRYATAGDSGATAVNVSSFAVGQQQRAYVKAHCTLIAIDSC